MTWTQFHDMHSGGGQKLAWAHIFIEAPELEAKAIFWHRFKRNPERVTCTCCGEDYSISSEPSLELATQYERGCRFIHRDGTRGCGDDGRWLEPHEDVPEGWTLQKRMLFGAKDIPERGLTMAEYRERAEQSGNATFIDAKDISPDECHEQPPREGYVWAGSDE